MHAAELTEASVSDTASTVKKANDEDDDEGSIEIAFTYTHDASGLEHDRFSILIDTGSNCSVFNNRDFLLDIH